jgi:sec-independent protein translocase protein TatB
VFNLQGSEIIIILLLALVVLGPEKLPEAMRKAGKFYADIRKMSSGFQEEFRSALDEPVKEMRETANLLRDSADFTKLQDGERDEKPQSAQMPTPAVADDDAQPGDEGHGSGAGAPGAPDGVDGADGAPEPAPKPVTREYRVDPAAMGVPRVARDPSVHGDPETADEESAEAEAEVAEQALAAPFASTNTLGPRPTGPRREPRPEPTPERSGRAGDAEPSDDQYEHTASDAGPPPVPPADGDAAPMADPLPAPAVDEDAVPPADPLPAPAVDADAAPMADPLPAPVDDDIEASRE